MSSNTSRPIDARQRQPESNGQPAVISWEIGMLKEHPEQAAYFPNESEQADQELAADMQADGLREPVDILPDGTILGGHHGAPRSRLSALRSPYSLHNRGTRLKDLASSERSPAQRNDDQGGR